MHIIFRDRSQPVIDALVKSFYGTDAVANYEVGDLFGDPPTEPRGLRRQHGEQPNVVLSPANSFGFMNGGVDQAIADKFPGLEARVKSHIHMSHNGELPVGQAFITILPTREIEAAKDPLNGLNYCIVAPTMRTPQRINGTVNVYLAFRAALIELKPFGDDLILLCPGMGTATGTLDPGVAAYQMRAAWDAVMVWKRPQWYDTLGAAMSDESKLRHGR